MSDDGHPHLLSVVRRADGDPAAVALGCARTVDPDIDVEVALLHVDALADQVRVHLGGRAGIPAAADLARALPEILADRHGFRGDPELVGDPAGSMLTEVLERRTGRSLVLSMLYASVGRRLGAQAFAIVLPEQALAGIAADGRPIVLDPYDRGRQLDERSVAARVTAGDGSGFRRAMLRPATATDLARGLLRELRGSLAAQDRAAEALRASSLLIALPETAGSDEHEHGLRLTACGRFDLAADAHERVVSRTDDSELHARARRAAIEARARMN